MTLFSGLKAHLWQLISAVFLAIYLPCALFYLWLTPTPTLTQLQQTLAWPPFLIPTLLALALLLIHSWVGVRDILIDYLPPRWQFPALLSFGLLLALMASNLMLIILTLV